MPSAARRTKESWLSVRRPTAWAPGDPCRPARLPEGERHQGDIITVERLYRGVAKEGGRDGLYDEHEH
jgi:hypothetical protein